jgi:hypothetical protein
MANKGKFDFSSARKLKFVRYGGLSSVNQRGYDPNKDNFHAPPARRGIYSFVWPLMEPFLLGGDEFINPKKNEGEINRMNYVRDKDGNIIDSNHPEYAELCEKHSGKYWSIGVDLKPSDEVDGWDVPTRWILMKKIKPKTFSYDGDIWHHFVEIVDERDVLARQGAWVKTSMETYKKCLRKVFHETTKDHMRDVRAYQDKEKRNGYLNNARSSGLRYGVKDMYEVFIEKV